MNKSFILEYEELLNAVMFFIRNSKYFLLNSENNLLENISIMSIPYGKSTAEYGSSCIMLNWDCYDRLTF